jgi:peptide-methionine (S)-S-oxide reductase
VKDTRVGYSGGHTKNPSYETVCSGTTEHVEVLELNFDETKISYEKLLDHFWKCHDPTTLNRQGPDVGRQYRSAIFYYSDIQKDIAEKSKIKHQPKFNNNIVTEITKADTFYLAEDYHQRFIQKRKETA